MYAPEASKLVYELMCTQQESKVVLPQPKVKTFSNAKMKIKLTQVRQYPSSSSSPCRRYLRLWTAFRFGRTPWLQRETAPLLWCGLNRRLSWLAPDGELRTTADCLVWPRSSADRSLVVAVILLKSERYSAAITWGELSLRLGALTERENIELSDFWSVRIIQTRPWSHST